MIRAVLAGQDQGPWKLYRQAQWMAEVRRSPDLARRSKRYFDLEEAAFSTAIESWDRLGAGSGLDPALKLLRELGAQEVTPP